MAEEEADNDAGANATGANCTKQKKSLKKPQKSPTQPLLLRQALDLDQLIFKASPVDQVGMDGGISPDELGQLQELELGLGRSPVQSLDVQWPPSMAPPPQRRWGPPEKKSYFNSQNPNRRSKNDQFRKT